MRGTEGSKWEIMERRKEDQEKREVTTMKERKGLERRRNSLKVIIITERGGVKNERKEGRKEGRRKDGNEK